MHGHPGEVNGLRQRVGALASDGSQHVTGLTLAVLWLRGCPGAFLGVLALLQVVQRLGALQPCVHVLQTVEQTQVGSPSRTKR